LKTIEKYATMTEREFVEWVDQQRAFGPSGRRNGNVTRALRARMVDVETFYDNQKGDK
jgi:hypothetical protein